MTEYQMGAVESRFADIIWREEPVTATQLAKFALEELSWKKTTAYTVLKRLCGKGIFQNEGGLVTSRLGRQEFYALQSEKIVKERFDGSLPAFVAAFTQRNTLSPEEVAQIRRMIDAAGEV